MDFGLLSLWGDFFIFFPVFPDFFQDFPRIFWQEKSGKTELALQGCRQQPFRFWLLVQSVFFHKGNGRNCPKQNSGPIHTHFLLVCQGLVLWAIFYLQ
jgi:hypothetical protein